MHCSPTTRTGLVAGITLSALSVLGAPAAEAQVRLLGIDSTPNGNTLYEIDPLTGTYTSLGQVTGITGAIGALTQDPVSGVVYLSSTSFDELYTFDPGTRVATLVGPYNVGAGVVMHGLEHDPATGRLYGTSSSASVGANLFEIDPLTGQGTPIGTTASTNAAGLAAIGGVMYLADTGTDQLYTVDLVTAASTPIGPFGGGTNIGTGLAYHPSFGLIAEDNLGDTLYSIDLTTGAATVIATHTALNVISLVFVGPAGPAPLGTAYCTANTNSTGVAASITASGSAVAANNDVTLTASSLPANSFGFFLISASQGFVANPGGSAGNLCLSGSIGRYVGPGQVQNSGAAGEFSLVLDLTQTPSPGGFVALQAGDTRNFQAWYRDVSGGVPTSNFTDGREIAFQ